MLPGRTVKFFLLLFYSCYKSPVKFLLFHETISQWILVEFFSISNISDFLFSFVTYFQIISYLSICIQNMNHFGSDLCTIKFQIQSLSLFNNGKMGKKHLPFCRKVDSLLRVTKITIYFCDDIIFHLPITFKQSSI